MACGSPQYLSIVLFSIYVYLQKVKPDQRKQEGRSSLKFFLGLLPHFLEHLVFSLTLKIWEVVDGLSHFLIMSLDGYIIYNKQARLTVLGNTWI